MAQDQRQQQPQPQQSQQSRPAANSLDDSLFYDQTNMPADLAPPVRGLLRRGWKCQADNFALENGLWFPPGVREVDEVVDVALFGNVMRPSKDPKQVDPIDGTPLAEPQWERLKMQSGRIDGSVETPITQTIIHPACKGFSFHEALRIERQKSADAGKEKKEKRERLVPVGAA